MKNKKNKKNKLSLFLMLFVYFFSMICAYIPIEAVENSNEKTKDILINGINIEEYNKKSNKEKLNLYSNFSNISIPLITIQGKTTYYLKFNNDAYSNEYVSNEFENDLIKRILYFGYPNNAENILEKYDISEEEANYWTQLAILKKNNQIDVEIDGSKYYKELISKAEDGYKLQENEDFKEFKLLEWTSPDIESQSLIQGFKLKEENDTQKKSSDVRLKIININESNNVVAGVKYAVFEDESLTSKISEGISNEKGEIIFENLQLGKIYYIKNTKTIDGYILNQEIIPIEIRENEATEKIVNNRIKRKINLSRIDEETKEKLADSKIAIREINYQYYQAVTSISEIQTLEIPLGKYVIFEVDPPENYNLSQDMIEIDATEEGEPIDVTIKSSKIKYNFEFKNIDFDNGQIIKNTKMKLSKIVDGEKEIIYQFVTYDKANKFELDYGQYSLEQLEPSTGYVKNDEIIEFTISENNPNVNLILKDKVIKGNLNISTIDSINKNIIYGCQYNVKGISESNKDVDTNIEVNENSTIHQFKYGEYEIKQIKAPDNYLKSDEIKKINISINEENVNIQFYNEAKGVELKIKNIDKISKEILLGMRLEIIGLDDHNKDFKKEIVISKDYEIINLAPGSYKIKEISPSNGYFINDKESIIKISENSKQEELVIESTQVLGGIEIQRTDLVTGEILPGAVFIIEGITENNKNVKLEFTTENIPKTVYLPIGKYALKEEISPEGYIKSEEIIEFEIKENGEVIKKNITNEKIKGIVRISNIDSETKSLISGVKMIITGIDESNKNYYYEFETSDDYEDIELYYGNYKVEKISSPIGYDEINSIYNFKVEDNKKTVEIIFLNKKIEGILNFKNIDEETNEILQAGRFEISGNTEENKDFKYEFIGSTKIPLKYGSYVLKEITPATGYLSTNETIEFNILNKNEEINREILSKKVKGTLSFGLVNSESKEYIDGAIYKITGIDINNKDFECEIETAKDMTIVNLAPGTYQLQQIKAKEGYKLDSEIHKFTLKHGESNIEVILENSLEEIQLKGNKLSFALIDSESNEYLSDAIYVITGKGKDNKDFEYEFITVKDKNIISLIPGSYELKQVKAPNGYVLDNKIHEFKIEEENTDLEIILENKLVIGKIEINTVSSYKETPLKGISIGIYDKNKNLIKIIESNSKGKATIELKYGEYYYKQTKTDENHIIDEEYYKFTISENEETISLSLVNKIKNNANIDQIPQTGGINIFIPLVISSSIIILGSYLIYNKKKLKNNFK